jgi:hypothetical protein
MTLPDLISELKRMDNSERLALIEVASRLIREQLPVQANAPDDLETRMRDAASRLKDLYEPGGELAEWTALDGEEVLDESDRRAR